MKNKHLSSRSLQSHIKNNTTCKQLSIIQCQNNYKQNVMGAQSGCRMEKSAQKGNSMTNNMEVKSIKHILEVITWNVTAGKWGRDERSV